jgi:NADPH-dependent 2,4-dienoyl-CoA reductase/sulfur reductase-like enzyme
MSPGMNNEGFVHVEAENGAMEVTNGEDNGNNGHAVVNGHDESHVLVVGAGPAGLMLA